MLSVADARQIILSQCRALPAELIPLSSAALGGVLAEPITSDVDSPPFDKALMDGYAVRSADVQGASVRLRIVEQIHAGQVPTRSLQPGEASQIMTGAPVPAGADAVVMHERTRLVGEGMVEIAETVRPGQHILRRAAEMQCGEVLLQPGHVLRPQEFGLLASVGRTAVRQVPAPRVAIVATGDELIEPGMTPGPGQIRSSNATMLLAQVHRAGGVPRYLGIARDRLDSLAPLIREALQTAEVLLITGGLSAGERDLVPQALQQAGVTIHFHKVAMKPGKPILFGTCERPTGRRLILGLPGNPVSSFVGFEVFGRPLVRTLAGHTNIDLRAVSARLSEPLRLQGDRPTYHPACLRREEAGWTVHALPWQGSPDLRALVRANGLLVLPAGEVQWPAGAAAEALLLDE